MQFTFEQWETITYMCSYLQTDPLLEEDLASHELDLDELDLDQALTNEVMWFSMLAVM